NNVRVAPTGIVLGDDPNQAILLDQQLQARRIFSLKSPGIDAALPLDDRYVLVAQADGSGTHHMSVYDAAQHVVYDRLGFAVQSSGPRYEPTTQLLAISEADGSWLVPLDPATHRFGRAYHLDGGASEVFLTDPKLADGVVAVA